MFGIGAQEMVLIGLLCLIIFGPGKFTEMVRELGQLARKARGSIDEIKSELDIAEDGDFQPEEAYHDYGTDDDLEPEKVR